MAVADSNAVKRSMNALGDKADIPAMVTWIKDNEKLSLSPRIVGLHRHHILRKKKKKKAEARKVKEVLSGVTPILEHADGVPMADLIALRDLMGRKGKGTVVRLVEMVS